MPAGLPFALPRPTGCPRRKTTNLPLAFRVRQRLPLSLALARSPAPLPAQAILWFLSALPFFDLGRLPKHLRGTAQRAPAPRGFLHLAHPLPLRPLAAHFPRLPRVSKSLFAESRTHASFSEPVLPRTPSRANLFPYRSRLPLLLLPLHRRRLDATTLSPS